MKTPKSKYFNVISIEDIAICYTEPVWKYSLNAQIHAFIRTLKMYKKKLTWITHKTPAKYFANCGSHWNSRWLATCQSCRLTQTNWCLAFITSCYLKWERNCSHFLKLLVMATIQDGQQYIYVTDLPKHSDVWLLLQVYIFNERQMVTIFVTPGYGCHPRWMTTCQCCRWSQTLMR